VLRHICSGLNLQTVIYHFPPNKVFPPHKHDTNEQMGAAVRLSALIEERRRVALVANTGAGEAVVRRTRLTVTSIGMAGT
jgi:hypothetical protein